VSGLASIEKRIPHTIRQLLTAFYTAGYDAVLVGGCVRDLFMGHAPADYDIATSALPDEVIALFSGHCKSVGKAFGTVIVPYPGGDAEVTTYREEADYADGRHPNVVRFTTDLTKDLARRDFTMNAMAWHPDRGITDPFGGQEDIRKKRLCAVGDPNRRLQEDALRILRGVRFAARFGLKPDAAFLQAAAQEAARLKNISAERVFSETERMLTGQKPSTAFYLLEETGALAELFPELQIMVGFDQETPFHHLDLMAHTLCVTDRVAPEIHLRWAALLHDAGKPAAKFYDENGQARYYGHDKQSVEVAKRLLERLRAPNERIGIVCALIGHHMANTNPYTKKSVKKLLRKIGRERLEQLFLLQEADCACASNQGAGHVQEGRALLQEILAAKEPFSTKQLAVNGRDLIGIGIPEGPMIGYFLQRALAYTEEHPDKNHRQLLLAKIQEERRNVRWENTSAPTASAESQERS